LAGAEERFEIGASEGHSVFSLYLRLSSAV